MNKQNLLLLSSTSVGLIQKCTEPLFPLAKGFEKGEVAQPWELRRLQALPFIKVRRS